MDGPRHRVPLRLRFSRVAGAARERGRHRQHQSIVLCGDLGRHRIVHDLHRPQELGPDRALAWHAGDPDHPSTALAVFAAGLAVAAALQARGRRGAIPLGILAGAADALGTGRTRWTKLVR